MRTGNEGMGRKRAHDKIINDRNGERIYVGGDDFEVEDRRVMRRQSRKHAS